MNCIFLFVVDDVQLNGVQRVEQKMWVNFGPTGLQLRPLTFGLQLFFFQTKAGASELNPKGRLNRQKQDHYKEEANKNLGGQSRVDGSGFP